MAKSWFVWDDKVAFRRIMRSLTVRHRKNLPKSVVCGHISRRVLCWQKGKMRNPKSNCSILLFRLFRILTGILLNSVSGQKQRKFPKRR